MQDEEDLQTNKSERSEDHREDEASSSTASDERVECKIIDFNKWRENKDRQRLIKQILERGKKF